VRPQTDIQIQGGDGTDNEIAGILIVELAGIQLAEAGLPCVIALQVEHVLLGVYAKVEIGEWADHFGDARKRNSECAQVAILQISEALGAHAGQEIRQATRARSFEFLHARVGDQNAQVGLQALFDRVVQGEAQRGVLGGG